MQMIDYNPKDLVRFLTQISTNNCLWMAYKGTNFQLDWSTSLQVRAILQASKRRRKMRKFIRNDLRNFLKIW